MEKKKKKGQKLKKYIDAKGKSFSYLYFDKSTKIFYVRHREFGKISLETADAKIAIPKIMMALSTLEARKRKTIVRDGENVLWRDVYTKMLDLKTADEMRPATLRRMNTIWKLHLQPYWANLNPKDLNQQTVDDFKIWHSKEFPEQQLVNVFKYLGNMFRIASEYKWLSDTVLPRLELTKTEERHHNKVKGLYIPHAEFLQIVEHLNPRYGFISKVAYYMGMRKMEIGALTCERVVANSQGVYINLSEDDTKTGLARSMPVPLGLQTELLRLRDSNGRYLFPMLKDETRHLSEQSIDSSWRKARSKAKIRTRYRFHDTRHTRATDFAKENINPVLAVTYLGMSLRTYQKRYLKLQKEDLLIISESADRMISAGSSR